MNILFLTQTFYLGGVSMVTIKLANEFTKRGHNATIVTFYDEPGSSSKKYLSENVKCYMLKGLECSKENIVALNGILVENNPQIIINQWGLNPVILRTAQKASRNMKIKFISVYHSMPNMNGRLQEIDTRLLQCSNFFKSIILTVQRWFVKEITSASMRRNYYNSDLFIVLSKSFIPIFEEFTHIKNAKKLSFITNPLTRDNEGYKLLRNNKLREIIFVGRLDNTSKKINRILDVWGIVFKQYPEWNLSIIGEGPDKFILSEIIKQKGLKNISLKGALDPQAYYERASILILTSEFEGFPLTIPEAMSFGVVPIVYGSFSSVYDIISNNSNGIVIPYNKKGFNPDEMALELSKLMENENKRWDMAQKAYSASKNYTIDKIYQKWLSCFNNLIDSKVN